MFPGQYSGVVSPHEHYIPLEKDFSNMDEVVKQLRDDDLVAAMTTRAHDELINSGRWSYQTFVTEFDAVIDEEAAASGRPLSEMRYRLARAERVLRVPGPRLRVFRSAHAAWTRIFRKDSSMRFAIEYDSQIEKGFLAMRILLSDRELRSLFRLGRRAGAPLDRLLREILELSLLRHAANASTGQAFTLSSEFDAERMSLCFVSMPVGHNMPDRQSSSREIRDALRTGDLRIIQWDHRALGGKLQVDRTAMEVGIGFQGLESFTVLAGIGRQNPAALENALAPVLAAAQPAASRVDGF
jgi:hypothetical protein